ncbi:MAG: DUF1684 domain-containing protein [Elusimicrobia bacterium]|nr:DUF1684 domain-containing protein [Elusimicrobiota bacterium]
MHALLLALCAVPALAAPSLPPKEAAAVRAAILKDRADTRKWLRSSPTSYLAATARRSFGEKTELSVGSASDNDVVLPGLKPHELRISVGPERFHVRAVDPGAAFTLGKSTRPETSADTLPSKVGLGRWTLALSHQGYPALIVFDKESKDFARYKGIPYFPVDLSYRYVLPLIKDPRSEDIDIRSTNSGPRRGVRVGWFEFKVHGKAVRLEADRLLEPGWSAGDVAVFFRDETTGHESYSVGRFLDPEKQKDGRYVLDFNMAYNPACAYSPYYNCPIPPKGNTLPVAIRAGEKDPHYHR